ncbi:unnamed protein product, partial [Mesorhabditis spiculigera]
MVTRACAAIVLLAVIAVHGQSSTSTTETWVTTAAEGQTSSATAMAGSTTGYDWGSTATPQQPSTPQTVGKLGCGCNHSSLWLDIMLVLDSSSAMTGGGLQELQNYIGTAVLRMAIGQQTGQMSRIGIITYSDKATLRAPLTMFNSSDNFVDGIFGVPFENLGGSNIEAGIQLAVAEFEKNGQGSFANRKKVIVLAASHYEPGGSVDPKQTAATFRLNGEYVQTHGATVPVLSELASNCSQLTNRNEDLRADDLLDKFCLANCFCATNWNPYSMDSQCYTPDQGCYFPVTIPSAFVLAQRYCHNRNGATLPTVCDADKANYMASQLKNAKEAQWTGLQNVGGNFQWDDGTSYASCQPGINPSWVNGTATSGQPVAQVTISGFRQGFFGAPSFNDYLYTCQNAPCSSTLYCA